MVRRSLIFAIVAAALASSPASAATTLGATYPDPGSGALNCSGDRTMIQTATTGTPYAAPFDGVITSWAVEDFYPTVKFKVARLGGGDSFSIIAEDGPKTVPDDQLTRFPVRIPVRQGDAIGLWIAAGAYFCPEDAPGATYRGREGDVSSGTSSGFTSTSADSYLPVTAQLEADGDGDGFGDETQDECPTNASTQGACPLPTVLGRTFTPFSGVQSCSARTRVITNSPGTVSTAPADGVITSWSHLAQNDVGTGAIKLKAFRPLGGADYRVIGESALQKPTPNSLNTFGTRVPVRQGDKIGLAVSDGVVPCSQFTAPGGYGITDGDVAVGGSATFASNTGALDISAVLEADADADGFGDSSQDLCSTDAGTQGACRSAEPPIVIVPPADDTACDKARKKLKKAKAKLKKLTEADAKVKKVEAAEKKVKKAKKAVKKAC